MKKFIKEHLIQTWIIASIVFAILIHILFVTDAPCDKLQAQWGAGDILTYTSTVALGLLAVWQNQKFKEENDRAQDSSPHPRRGSSAAPSGCSNSGGHGRCGP